MYDDSNDVRGSSDGFARPGTVASGRALAARRALEAEERRKQQRGRTQEGMVTVNDSAVGPRPGSVGSGRMLRRKGSEMMGDASEGSGSSFKLKDGKGGFYDERMQEFDATDGMVRGARMGPRSHLSRSGQESYEEAPAPMPPRPVIEQVVKPRQPVAANRLHVSRGGFNDEEEEAPAPPPRRPAQFLQNERESQSRMHQSKGQRWEPEPAREPEPEPEPEEEPPVPPTKYHNSRRTLEEELDYEEPEDPPEESEDDKEAKRQQVLRELEEKERREIAEERERALALERKRQEARRMKEAALAKEQAKAEAQRQRQAAQARPQDVPQGIYQGADALTPTADWDISADVEAFLFTPPPKGMTVQCRVEREKGLLSKMNQVYFLFLESNNQFLLAARKRSKKSKSANYLISLDKKDLSRSGSNYVGKLRSNFIGTEFVFYDRGENPEVAFQNVPEGGEPDPNVVVRQELGGVIYAANVLGWKGPRKMKIVIPAVVDADRRAIWQPMRNEESMVEKFKVNQLEDLVALQNKSPVWNEETKSYVLNFHNRVKQASVKNFQVCFPDDTDTVLMQFGRVSGGVFSLDFSYPLSLFQAFCIALSSFDNKLACE